MSYAYETGPSLRKQTRELGASQAPYADETIVFWATADGRLGKCFNLFGCFAAGFVHEFGLQSGL